MPETETVKLRTYIRPKDLLISVDLDAAESHIRLGEAARPAKTSAVENYDDAFYPTPFASAGRGLESPALRDAFVSQVQTQARRWDEEGYRHVVINYRRDSEVASFAQCY